jgi:hypothetical protein
MDRLRSGTRLLVYVDPSVPSAEAHQRLDVARAALALEPADLVVATDEQRHNDVAERELTHLADIGPGEPTDEYLGVWATLDELEKLARS